MVRIYCQYSYGGFKNFAIKGEANEPLENEVSNDNAYDFPEDANIFFSYGGVKIIYRELNNKEYTLVIKEIPSAHIDGDGRPIICSVQFIGGVEDRHILDNMTISIANDIDYFETFFKDLFFEKNGLRIEGDKLRTYINSFDADYVFSGDSKLLNIPNLTVRVRLLVALSNNFGSEKAVTEKVLRELNLGQDTQRGKTLILTYQTLLNQQGWVIVCKKEENSKPIQQDSVPLPTPPTPSPSNLEEVLSLRNKCISLENGQTKIINQLTQLLKQHNSVQREIAKWMKYTQLLAGGVIILILLALIRLIF